MASLQNTPKTGSDTAADRQAVLAEREIDTLEASLSMLYFELGKKIYEAAEPNIAEIGKTVDKLIAAKQRQAALAQKTACPHCLAMNPAENTYCGKCGAKLT